MENNQEHVDSKQTSNIKTSNISSSLHTLTSAYTLKRLSMLYVLILIGTIFYTAIYLTAQNNSNIFILKSDTIGVMTETYNAIILLFIPFIFGGIGAIARVLLAGLEIIQSYKLIVSSGLMASFSWLGIKSKLFISLLTPYVEKKYSIPESLPINQAHDISTEFYSMVLIAVLVGMFASNIYIFINQRVEQLTAEKSNYKDKTQSDK